MKWFYDSFNIAFYTKIKHTIFQSDLMKLNNMKSNLQNWTIKAKRKQGNIKILS